MSACPHQPAVPTAHERSLQKGFASNRSLTADAPSQPYKSRWGDLEPLRRRAYGALRHPGSPRWRHGNSNPDSELARLVSCQLDDIPGHSAPLVRIERTLCLIRSQVLYPLSDRGDSAVVNRQERQSRRDEHGSRHFHDPSRGVVPSNRHHFVVEMHTVERYFDVRQAAFFRTFANVLVLTDEIPAKPFDRTCSTHATNVRHAEVPYFQLRPCRDRPGPERPDDRGR